MMKKTLFVLVSVLLVMLVSCNLNLYTSAFSDQTINTAISEDSSFDGSAPVVLTATKAGYTDKIVLSWSSVAGADYYQISRAVEGSSEFTVLPVSVKETTYEDFRTNSNPLSSGVRYQYKINARSNTVTLSETTNYSPVAAGSLLCAPSELSAGKGASETGIVITWSTMPDVRKYAVYKSDSPSFDKADNFIASVPALQNVGSQSYKYMISVLRSLPRSLILKYFSIKTLLFENYTNPSTFIRNLQVKSIFSNLQVIVIILGKVYVSITNLYLL